LNQEYKVFYIGTNTGRIYKIVQFMQNGESKSTLLDIFEVATNEPIQVMQISQKRKSLYVSTDHRIKQIDLAMCSRRYDSCFRCVKDPYCGWDQETNSCKPYELGLLQVSHFMLYPLFFLRIRLGKWKMPLQRICVQNSFSHFYGIRVSFYYTRAK
jgi:Sema domain/Plexin repeat